MVKRLTKEFVCTIHRQGQYGNWLREGKGWEWVEVGKGRKTRNNCNRINDKNTILTIFYWLCYYNCPIFSLLYSLLPCTTSPSSIPHPQVMSMDRTYKFFGFSFPILFLTSPCLFCIYQLCFLFLKNKN